MRVPQRLAPLMDQGIIQEVVRPLLSGKEAKLFLVISEGEPGVTPRSLSTESALVGLVPERYSP